MNIGNKQIYPCKTVRYGDIPAQDYIVQNEGMNYREWLIGMIAGNLLNASGLGTSELYCDKVIKLADEIIAQLDKEGGRNNE